MEDITTQEDDLFQPAPTHWKQIMALTLYLRSHWARIFKTELSNLLKMNAFSMEEKPAGEPIIPVTAKLRVKINPTVQSRISIHASASEETSNKS